ncbi:hypothetical protein Scep_025087 [Stephania cephalantha]|uniref:Uncharacterized protein n=1 Tax=Stephania cephalantha TaxID=152367 RepID=A0AAP0F397_9MAGN
MTGQETRSPDTTSVYLERAATVMDKRSGALPCCYFKQSNAQLVPPTFLPPQNKHKPAKTIPANHQQKSNQHFIGTKETFVEVHNFMKLWFLQGN